MQPGSVSMSATTGKTTYIRPEFLSCCLICGKTKNKKETHFRSLGADSKDEVERVAAGWVKDYIGLVVSQAVCCRNCFLRMESLDIKVKRLRESCKKTLESLTVTVTTGSGGSVTLNESEVERLTGFGCCTSDSEIDRFPAKLWFPLQLKPEVDLPEGITTSQANFIVEKNDSSDADSSVPSCDEDEQHKEGAESSRRRPAGNFVHLKNRTSPSDEQPELDTHVLSEAFGAHSTRPVADGHKLEPGEIPARPGPSLSPPVIVSTLSKEKTTPVQCKRGPGRPRKRPLSPNSVMLEHPLVPVYPCDHCSGMFKNLKDYDTHVKSHNDLLKKKKKMKGLELIRPKLKKRRNAELKAETQSLLGISVESAKPKQLRLTKLHRCTACPRKYRTKMLLINHVALIHERACLMCGFEVYSGRVLQEHKLVCKGMIGRNQDMLTST